jgi:hypothetical protein
MFVGGCSGDGRWRATRAGCSPTSPCPWAGTGAAAPSCSRGCPVARGGRDRQRPPDSPAARPGGRARPSLSPEHRARVGAAARALRASVPVIRARLTRRVVRSPRVPTADPWRAPVMRAPSLWPGTVRVAPSAGRATMASWRGFDRGGLGLAPETAAPPPGPSAACRGAPHPSPPRGSRPRSISPCRQETRGEGGRQSVRASRPQPDAFAHLATARGRGGSAVGGG